MNVNILYNKHNWVFIIKYELTQPAFLVTIYYIRFKVHANGSLIDEIVILVFQYFLLKREQI